MDTDMERIKQENEYREEATRYAEAAIKDLARRTGAGQLQSGRDNPFYERYRTIGESIVSRFSAEGGIRYIGERVETPEKLAALMQSYRNPLFETMRFVYIKDGMVVDAESYSNHLPNYTVLPFRDHEFEEHINGRMKELDADGYYIVHNHPSGDPSPSLVDQQLTYRVAHHIEGYLGHIITNHVRYALIDRDAEYQIHQLDVIAEDPFRGASIEHPLLGEKIASPDAVASAGKALQTADQSSVSVLIYASSKIEIRKIQEISNEIFAEPEFKTWLGREMRSIGATNTFCVTGDQDVYDRFAEPLIRQRFLQDMVYIDADYPFYWSKWEAGVQMDPTYLYAGMTEMDLEFIYQGGTNKDLAYRFTENLVGEEESEWRNEMKIQRMVDGKNQEFALTNEEIFQAYLQKEREFDKQDVRNAVYEMDEEDRFKLEYNLGMSAEEVLADEKLVERIAKDMRSRMNKQDIEKETAFWQTVKVAVEREVSKVQVTGHYQEIYPHSFGYAKEQGEIEQFRDSMRVNQECKEAIERAIRENFDGMHLNPEAVSSVLEEYGEERTALILSATVRDHDWDMRFSRDNREWADSIPLPDSCYQTNERTAYIRPELIASSHSAIMDGFITTFREEIGKEVERKAPQEETVQIGDCKCTKTAEWDCYGNHYLLGRATDQDTSVADWHYAIINNNQANIIEYDHRPSKEKVESDYTDMEAERDIDRQEVEFGADGWRAFGGSEEDDFIDQDFHPMEYLNELSYRDQFKVVLGMEFPETIGEDKLQEELFERFMEDDSESGFFSERFKAAAEKDIKAYQESRQKELDSLDDILII